MLRIHEKSLIFFTASLVLIVGLLPQNYASLEIKRTLRVASDLSPHFLTKIYAHDGRHYSYKGFVKDFCEELVNILGYQCEIVLPHNNRPGGEIRVNTSEYLGDVFGMLLRNEVDLAFGDTEITMDRSQNFDFSSPVLSTRFAVLYGIDNMSVNFADSHWTIFNPFPVSVWVPFLFIAMLYFGFFKFQHLRPNPFQLSSVQKLKHSKKFARIIFFVWLLFLFTSYVSNYAAQKVLKTTFATNVKPENIVDLASRKDIKIGWLARGPVERFFRNTVNEMYQKIYLQNVGRDWVSSVNEGVNKVLNENGRFAFILDSFVADHEAELDCNLYKLPQEFGPTRSIAVATTIGSPLRERINQAVLSLSEQGIIEALSSRHFSSVKEGHCSSRNEHWKSLNAYGSVQEMSPIFVVAIVGLFIAIIIGLLEMHLIKKPRAPQPKPPRQQAELLPKFNLESV